MRTLLLYVCIALTLACSAHTEPSADDWKAAAIQWRTAYLRISLMCSKVKLTPVILAKRLVVYLKHVCNYRLRSANQRVHLNQLAQLFCWLVLI